MEVSRVWALLALESCRLAVSCQGCQGNPHGLRTTDLYKLDLEVHGKLACFSTPALVEPVPASHRATAIRECCEYIKAPACVVIDNG